MLQYQLLDKPLGMTVDSVTGIVRWMPTEGGVYSVTVGAIDGSGVGAAQQFEVTARVNNAPTINSIPVESVTVGGIYKYDIKASDPNGDSLSFTLDKKPVGMSIDKFGRILWSPTSTDIGIHRIEVTVADPNNATESQSYDLTVNADTLAPKVNLFVSKPQAALGDEVTFVVQATDNVAVSALTLTVGGKQVALDAQGRAKVLINTAGEVQAVATATDAAGNIGTAASTLRAIDPFDADAPVLAFE